MLCIVHEEWRQENELKMETAWFSYRLADRRNTEENCIAKMDALSKLLCRMEISYYKQARPTEDPDVSSFLHDAEAWTIEAEIVEELSFTDVGM